MEIVFISIQGLMGEANLRFVRGDRDTAVRMCMEVIRQVSYQFNDLFLILHLNCFPCLLILLDYDLRVRSPQHLSSVLPEHLGLSRSDDAGDGQHLHLLLLH